MAIELRSTGNDIPNISGASKRACMRSIRTQPFLESSFRRGGATGALQARNPRGRFGNHDVIGLLGLH
jgi:hypothetical protein